MNKPKAKGTATETAVVKYARLNGFAGADRQPLRGNRDAGDILLCPGIVIEVKAHRCAGTGQPAPAQLATWMGQANQERYNAGAAHCPLIVKRSGTTNVARWFAYLPFQDIADLLGATTHLTHPPSTAPICMAVGSLIALLRAAGYGDPEETAP